MSSRACGSLYHYGSIFSGAGLLDLGLAAALPRLACRFAVELVGDRRAIFAAHFPGVPIANDITLASGDALPRVGGLVGGIPCSNLSSANVVGGRGLDHGQSALWTHARRLVNELSPQWCLFESSGAGSSWRRWVPRVRRELWRSGYASVPIRMSPHIRGAPHERERIFVLAWCSIANADKQGEPARAVHGALARLRSTPITLWDGRHDASASGRLANGIDTAMGKAIGAGVDQRACIDVAAVLDSLLAALA